MPAPAPAPSPAPAPASSDAARCFNLDFFFTPGNVERVSYRVSGGSTGTSVVQRTAIGAASFNGQAVFDIEERGNVDLTTPGSGRSQDDRVVRFHVQRSSATDVTLYGYTGSSNGSFTPEGGSTPTTISSATVTVRNEPPFVDTGAAMALGETRSFSMTQITTSTRTTNGVTTGPTTSTFTHNRNLTFVRIEPVTVPAGTFDACRYVDTVGGITWYAVDRGVKVRIEALGTFYEATEATLNGAPI